MASTKAEAEGSGMELKHLGFVRIIAINAVVMVTNLYDYAKQNSGPLKSRIGTVENAVTAVVSPVYEKFRGIPSDLLVFLDRKVDEATQKFDECAPPLAKKAVSKVQIVVQKASQVAQELVKEAQVAGPRAAIFHAGTMSKRFAVNRFAVVWYKVNHMHLIGVAESLIQGSQPILHPMRRWLYHYVTR